MGDDSTILKEYLISIGVSADIETLGKFKQILGAIEKMAVSMTTAMAAGVVAIEGLVFATTSKLDDLYWASKRLKSSAADIQDFQLQMEKAGGSAEDARQQLEALNTFRFTNPFADQFFSLFGVSTKGKGAVDAMEAIIARMKQLDAQGPFGRQMALSLGRGFGLSDAQIIRDIQQVGKAEDVYLRMYKRLGINQEQALKDAHEYKNELRDLGAEFDVVSQELGLRFLPVADKVLKWLMNSDAAHEMGGALLKVGGDLADIGDKAARLFNAMPKDSQEMGIVGFLLFGRKGLLVGTLIGAASNLLDKATGDTGKVHPEKILEAGESRRPDRVLARKLYDAGLGYLNTNDFNATYAEYLKKKAEAEEKGVSLASLLGKQDAVPKPPASAALPGGGHMGGPNAPLASMRTAIEKALRHEDARLSGKVTNDSGGLTKFGISQKSFPKLDIRNLTADQARALYKSEYWDKLAKAVPGFEGLSQGLKESALDAAVNQGVGRAVGWLKTSGGDLAKFNALREARYRELAAQQPQTFGKDLAGWLSRLGPATASAKAALPPPPAGSGATGHPGPSVMVPGSMRSPPIGASQGGGKSLTIQQHTEVTIHGARDPDRTAAQTKKALDRSNGDLVRNFSPALK